MTFLRTFIGLLLPTNQHFHISLFSKRRKHDLTMKTYNMPHCCPKSACLLTPQHTCKNKHVTYVLIQGKHVKLIVNLLCYIYFFGSKALCTSNRKKRSTMFFFQIVYSVSYHHRQCTGVPTLRFNLTKISTHTIADSFPYKIQSCLFQDFVFIMLNFTDDI